MYINRLWIDDFVFGDILLTFLNTHDYDAGKVGINLSTVWQMT